MRVLWLSVGRICTIVEEGRPFSIMWLCLLYINIGGLLFAILDLDKILSVTSIVVQLFLLL